MRIGVTDHAVEQYRKKMLRYCKDEMSDDEIRAVLVRVVEQGRRCGRCPGGATRYVLGDVAVVVDISNTENITVVTFLGDNKWRWWWKHKEMRARRSPKVLAAL